MKYCGNCGNELENGIKFCPKCGNQVSYDNNYSEGVRKSKMAAGILGILLGSLGIHNFYLGYTNKAVAQLLLTMVGWIFCGIGPLVAGIWGFVEGILILTGSIHQDSDGNDLIN